MGIPGPVDVAGGDVGTEHVGVGDRQLAAVVTVAFHRQRVPGVISPQGHDLAPSRCRVRRVDRRLAVEPQVVGGQLDDPVGLTRHHIGVLGESHIERLTTAPLGQTQHTGFVGTAQADRH